MIPLGILTQIYIVSMLVGGAFIAINVFMGNLGENADDGGAGGDAADGGGHDFGGSDSSGADGGSGGDDFGGANSGRLLTPGMARINLSHAGHRPAISMHSTPVIPRLSSQIGSFLLGLLSPMAISLFLTFFGVFGLLFERLTPWMGLLTLIPAVLISTAISNVFKFIVRYLIVHGNVSTEAKIEDTVGQVGEIITPISGGRKGEVTYVIGSKRYHSTAVSTREGIEFKRGSKVLITEIKDHIVYVEECTLMEFQ